MAVIYASERFAYLWGRILVNEVNGLYGTLMRPRAKRLVAQGLKGRGLVAASYGCPRVYLRREELLAGLELITDRRIDRYWELTATINGWPPFPSTRPRSNG